jgi:hypothetical protein
VLGIIVANAVVIQGARDAADSISQITNQVSDLTTDAIETVDVISGGIETSKAGLLNYSNSVILLLQDLKEEARTAKNQITTKVEQRIANASYVIEFTAVKTKIDETIQANAARGIEVMNDLIGKRTGNDLVEILAKHMLMVADMVTEIEKYEEMIVTFGDIAVGAVNDFGVLGDNRTVSLDFRMFFDYLDNMKNGVEELRSFIEEGPLVNLNYEIPSTEIRASAMLDAVSITSSVNITAVLNSQFNRIFTLIEDTIDVTVDRLNDYIFTQWEGPADELLDKMEGIRQILEQIRQASNDASKNIRIVALLPGLIVGSYGIIIAIVVEIFAVVSRMKRQKGTIKTVQLTLQNVLYMVTYILVDVYVMVSFTLALVFMLIGGLQLSLSMICVADLSLCDSIKYELTPAVKMMIIGVICNTVASYHLIGAIQGTWARFLGSFRHCCGNALAHSAEDYALNMKPAEGADDGIEAQKIARNVAQNKKFKSII